MTIRNAIDKLLTAGDLAYAQNYVDTRVYQDLTTATLPTLKNLFEQLAYTTVGDIQDFEASHSFEDEKKITVDNCGVGDIDISVKRIPKIKFKWLDVDNLTTFAKMLGLTTVSVPATAVPAFAQVVASGDWKKGVFIAFANQNGNGAAITPTSVNGSVTGAIVAGATTYTVGQDSLGRYGITFAAAFAGVETQTITITYAYTPYAQTLTGYKAGVASTPFNVYRFRSCQQDCGPGIVNPALILYKRDTIYFVKAYLTSEVLETYVNRARTDFAGTEIEFTVAEGGYYVKVKETYEA